MEDSLGELGCRLQWDAGRVEPFPGARLFASFHARSA